MLKIVNFCCLILMYLKQQIHIKRDRTGERNEMTNTAIYIDYDNVFITLDRYYKKYDTLNIQQDFIQKFFAKFSSDNVLHSRAYLNFHNISLTDELFNEFRKNMVQLYHIHSGNNTSDVQLIIDVIKSLYDPNVKIDKYIIVSSDSDMIPLINELKINGKEYEIYYFAFNTNLDYQDYLQDTNSKFTTIESILGLEVYSRENESKFDDTEYLKGILTFINNLINKTYTTYLKVDNGEIISAGATHKGLLRDYLEQNNVFVREDLKSGFAIDTLFKKGILYEYELSNGFKAILINETIINSKGITLNNIKKESDFKFPITV